MRRLYSAGMLAAGVGAFVACGTAARAQGLLPAAGVDTRVGDLRGYFAQAFGNLPAPEAGTHAWTFSGGLDLSETYDTGLPLPSASGNRVGHDLITRIGPSVGVSGDSSRLVGSLFYSPSANIYTYHGNQNGIDHNLNAAATATVIPDLFFVDLRGYAALQSISGFNGPTGTTVVNRSNQVQTTSFSIGPTLRHQFGGTATAEAGVTVSRTSIEEGNNAATTSTGQQSLNETSITQEERAVVSTGEDFGRLNDSLSVDATQGSGTGGLSTVHSSSISNSVGYAVSHAVVVTSSFGHENISYGGPTPYKIDDAIWSVGLHLTPDPDSVIDIRYGRQQGDTSAYLDASYAMTANTRISATYSQGVGTNAGNLRNSVAASTVGPNGVTFNPATGSPVLLNNNFFGTRPGLFRTKQGSLAGTLLWPRDLFNVSVQHSETTQLATGVAGSTVNNSTSGTYGNISWAHDFSDDLHSNALAQYGVNSGAGFGNNTQNSVLLNVGLSYSISDTLSLSAQYTHTTEPSEFGGRSGAREIAVVSVHKAF